jgi:hypothetical protein
MTSKRKGPIRTELPLRLVADLALPDGVILPAGSLIGIMHTWVPGTAQQPAQPMRTVRYLPEGAYPWNGCEVDLPVEAVEAATGKDRSRL